MVVLVAICTLREHSIELSLVGALSSYVTSSGVGQSATLRYLR